MKLRLVAALLFLGAFSTNAQDITYSEHIAPIIFEHCTKCHRPGEIAPFPLTNYAEASDYAVMIEYVTNIRYMPPWSPDPEYVHFRDENVLSDEEIDLIAQWVAQGSVQGDPDLEPDPPVFPEGSQIGTPDLILTMEEAYFHAGDNTDQYQIFVLETGLTEDIDIKAIEVRADNNNVCHHAILGVDTTNTAYGLDAADPDYGYEEFGGFGFDPTIDFWGAWVPGSNPLVYPPTIGTKLFEDSKVLLQMHYGPSSVDEYDQTSINIFFADDPIQRYIYTFPISPYNLDQLFLIPPGEVTTFHGTQEVDFDVSLLGIAPHCHLLGKSWEVFAVTPDNDTIPMISVPEWDFNWQGFYTYNNMLHIPAGSVVHCFATYDNTVDNPSNPNNPPQWSYWGEGTTDEMYLCYLTIIPYLPGDEDISLAAANSNNVMVYPSDELFPSYPNPTRSEFTIGFSLESDRKVNIDLLDAQGRKVKSLAKNQHYPMGYHKLSFDVSGLSAGTYFYRMYYDGFDQSHVIFVAD
jgi:hypothetical protein